MGTDKRTHAKQLERARRKREAERLAAKQRRSKVVIAIMVGLLVFGLVGAGLAGALSGGGTPPTVDEEPLDTGAAEDGDDASDEAAAAPDVEPCPPADDAPEPTAEVYDEAPRTDLDAAATYTATVATTCGEFVVELDVDGAPRAVENFVALAEDGYYTGTPFHRLRWDFVIQGGDAAGTGCGQEDCLDFDADAPTFPGYAIDDELATAETFEPDPDAPGAVIYPRGTVAMANSGPDSSGSQFFVVQADPGYRFLPDYTVLGTVTDGMDVVDRIAAGEVDGDRALDPAVVTEVRIDTA